MAVIDYTDVEISLGRTVTAAEQDQVAQWIGHAELLIFTRLGDLAALDQAVLAYVVLEAVLERFRNADGVDEITEAIDDYSHTRKWNGVKRVTIWDEWWELLSPATNNSYASIRPVFDTDDVAWQANLGGVGSTDPTWRTL